MKELIAKNFNLHSRTIPGQTPGMRVVDTESFSYVDSGLACDTFNIIHIKDGQLLTETELRKAIEQYNSKKYPYCIWISEENLTTQVKEIFAQLSLSRVNTEPGMVLDLLHYQPISSDLHRNAVVAEQPKHIADFADVIAANWIPKDENVLNYFQQTSSQYLDKRNNIILTIYYSEGKPVSVIEMFPTDTETIGLYSLASLSDFRGKGIGTALMTFSLNRAKALGYRTAILQASEDGIRIYQKLGFKVITNYYEYASQAGA